MTIFKTLLDGRPDDLACQAVPGFEHRDHETLARLANHHGAMAALNEAFHFEYEGLSFEGVRVADADYDEGESIDLKLSEPASSLSIW